MLGFFDSGIGGFFLFKALHARFPQESFSYLADYQHFPYGEKSPEEIYDLVQNNVEFLKKQGASQIVVACNTASAHLRTHYSIPVLGVIEAAVRQAAQVTVNKKIGLLATKGTVQSKAYEKLTQKLFPDLQIYSQACPLLSPYVEEALACENLILEEDPKLKKLLDQYLSPLLRKGVDTIIMGCTHYLFLKVAIEKQQGFKNTVSPLEFLVQDLKMRLPVESSSSVFSPAVSSEALILDERACLFINGGSRERLQKKFHQLWLK